GFSVTGDHLPTSLPKTDFAWDIDPPSFRSVLTEASSYGLPIVVTENGLADASDKNRARFITEHLYQAGLAIQNGVDLRGYFYWALMDNFEWDSGYCPKFGLYSVDPKTAARTQRSSALTYKSIIAQGTVRADAAASLPPYSAPTLCP
ncbi:MAG TPA: family 1 glycosylhydrolase, partial [Polyangiaceae bacterium]|nr:family 1 glycosylhydrolase [Polyangiaceae bacterium]